MAILPGALVFCFAGASASSLSDRTTSENNTVKIISIVSGIIFGGGGVYLGSYYSKKELDRVSKVVPCPIFRYCVQIPMVHLYEKFPIFTSTLIPTTQR